MNSNRGKQTPANENAANSNEEQSAELHRLFLDELADIYNAEQQLIKALPKMASAAQSPELRDAFQSHLEETQNQIIRLDEAVKSLGESLKTKKCKAMEGLLEEGDEIREENEDSPALDAALIAAAQKVEHYEIASYGTLCSWAESMGHEEALELLQETLGEEKAADEKLTEIAETLANPEAEERSSVNQDEER